MAQSTPPPAETEELPHPTEVAEFGRQDQPEMELAANARAPIVTAAQEAEARANLPAWVLTPDYVTVFEDRFRQKDLDISQWWTRFIFANGTLDYLNDEWQRFREDGNHVMTNEGIRLTAKPHNGAYWPSGMIRSKQCFHITDGNDYYFECRARVPRGKGTWSGFWIAADQRPADLGNWERYPAWPPEIDFMEVVNNGSDDTTRMLHLNVHVREWPGNPQQVKDMPPADPNFSWEWKVWWAPFDFADDFHVFGYHYKHPVGTWYCDNRFIARMQYSWVNDDRLPSGPAHICAQLSVGGAWAGRYGVDNTAFPQSLDIDYIRVHQRFQRGVIGQDLLKPGGGGGGGGNGGNGGGDAQLRIAMQTSLDQLHNALPAPAGSDPHLVASINAAIQALEQGLTTQPRAAA